MASYKIKELYYTIQGEGAQTGRPAVFCRFTGCNLWSGREEDRHEAICPFCDTDFWGTDGTMGGRYSGTELVAAIRSLWPDENTEPYVVCTGGEPLLQLDHVLVEAMKKAGMVVAIETNGTLSVPEGIDWVCMSPKANTDIVVRTGDELKIVFPQENLDPLLFADWAFTNFFIQPMDGPALQANIEKCVTFCKLHPKWRLSLQTHKLIGIP